MPSEEQTYRQTVNEKLGQILAQVEKTNGRVTRLEKTALVLGTAMAVVILLKIPELIPILGLLP